MEKKIKQRHIRKYQSLDAGYTSSKWSVPLKGLRSSLAVSSTVHWSRTAPFPPGDRTTVNVTYESGSSDKRDSSTITWKKENPVKWKNNNNNRKNKSYFYYMTAIFELRTYPRHVRIMWQKNCFAKLYFPFVLYSHFLATLGIR